MNLSGLHFTWNDELKLLDLVMLLAVLAGPLIGIRVQKFIEGKEAKHLRKEFIFRTLMATRRTQLSFEHVQALNLIDIDFYGKDKESKAVTNAWKAYQSHLNNHELLNVNSSLWFQKTNEKLFDLLEKMALALNFDIDRTHIETVSYLPEEQGRVANQQNEIREKLIQLLDGKMSVPIHIHEEKVAHPLSLRGANSDEAISLAGTSKSTVPLNA